MWADPPDAAHANLPMNCMNWYEAFAFCAWDGGRLPTEAEWNYAAAGGDQQRAYPWSSPPGALVLDAAHASYYDGTDCVGDGLPDCALTDLLAGLVQIYFGLASASIDQDGKCGHLPRPPRSARKNRDDDRGQTPLRPTRTIYRAHIGGSFQAGDNALDVGLDGGKLILEFAPVGDRGALFHRTLPVGARTRGFNPFV
jgi:hypothetical protein